MEKTTSTKIKMKSNIYIYIYIYIFIILLILDSWPKMKMIIVLIKSFAHPVIFTWYLNAYLSRSSDHLTHKYI